MIVNRFNSIRSLNIVRPLAVGLYQILSAPVYLTPFKPPQNHVLPSQVRPFSNLRSSPVDHARSLKIVRPLAVGLHQILSAQAYLTAFKPPQNHILPTQVRTFSNLRSSPVDQVRLSASLTDPTYRKIPPPANWGINFVWRNRPYIVERDGEYYKTLNPGIRFLNPFSEKIAYVHCLREQVIKIPIEKLTSDLDKFQIVIFGVLHIKIVDPVLASYGNKDDLISAITQLVKKKLPLRNMIEKIIFSGIFDVLRKYYDFQYVCPRYLALRDFDASDVSEIDDINNITTTAWGVKCVRIKIDFWLPDKNPIEWDDVKEILIGYFFNKERMNQAIDSLSRLNGFRIYDAIKRLRNHYRRTEGGGSSKGDEMERSRGVRGSSKDDDSGITGSSCKVNESGLVLCA
ncbi:hypothetical protein SLA2020_341930 [Shorea laevis]